MSIFSDYKYGYMNDDEFDMACTRMNMKDRYERNRYPDPYDYFKEDEFDYEIERDEYYD